MPVVNCADSPVPWGGSLGFAYWYPDWTSELSDFDSTTSGLYGPALFLYYKKAGIGFQFFTGEFDLDFPGNQRSISANRTDMDIIISYRIAKIFQVSGLYKNIHYDWNQTYSVDSKLTGFGFGGGINHIFTSNYIVFGFGFYMPSLDYDQTISQGSNYSGKATGYWLEGGIGYLVPHPRILAKLGYRYQTINIESNSIDWLERTNGIRADVSYYF